MKKFFFILFALFTILGQANAEKGNLSWFESWFDDPDEIGVKRAKPRRLSHKIAYYMEQKLGHTALLGPVSWLGSRSVHCISGIYPEDLIIENASTYMGLCCLGSCACAWCMAAAADFLKNKDDNFQERYFRRYDDKPGSLIMSPDDKDD